MDKMTKLAFYGLGVYYLFSMAYKMFTGMETQEADRTVLMVSGIIFAALGVALLVFIIVMFIKNKREERQRRAEQMAEQTAQEMEAKSEENLDAEESQVSETTEIS